MRGLNRLLFCFKYSLPVLLVLMAACQKKEQPQDQKAKPPQYKINIVSNKNGVGLSQDVEILETELIKLGHRVTFFEETDFKTIQHADINILVQPLNLMSLPYAKVNILIPNAEWCYFTPQQLAQFHMILCKTREGARIFKAFNANTVYLGFTCQDRYDASHKKNYKSPLHLVGASTQKGTDTVVKTWLKNPQWPKLTLLRHKGNVSYPPAKNIEIISTYLPRGELIAIQNRCGLHICPSETEGFGHYLMEGLSCGAVVVTTDAPPMNEFVSDKRCLAGYERTTPMQLAANYYVDSKKLDKVVTDLLSLSNEELEEMSKKNRALYLEMDRAFKERLASLFSSDFSILKTSDPAERAFAHIYENKLWGDQLSGEGAVPENTQLYRLFLQQFLKDHQIQNVVEIGPGDWAIGSMMDWKGIRYQGIDIYKQLVERNQMAYGSSTITFTHGNGLRMDLQTADLLLCKDVLQHLPNHEIQSFLPQLKKFKHCLIVNDVDVMTLTSENPECSFGDHRRLDLTKPPFNVTGQKILTFTCGGVTKQVLYIKGE